MPQMTAYFLPQRQKGGCDTIPAQGVATPHSFILLITLLLSTTTRPPACRTGEKGGDESDPQKKWGHVTLDSGAEWHASIRPHAGRSRPHLSLREGSENGQIGAPKALVRVSLFPSPLDDPGSVLAVKVRFAAARP